MKIIEAVLICGVFLSAGPAFCSGETAAGKAKPGAVDAEAVQVSTSSVPAAAGLVPGYRGTAIPVSGDQLLYVKKGDRVDLLVTFEAAAGKNGKETMTATILQNVIVINVRKPEKTEEMGAIELLLNPVEAQYAALSVSVVQGKNVNITVRAPGDTKMYPVEMASFRRLIK